MNFQGHITLIRAEQGAAREEDVGRDYGIGQVGEMTKENGHNKMDLLKVAESSTVHLVSGDHDSIVQGRKHIDTAAIINAVIFDQPIPDPLPSAASAKEQRANRKGPK